MKKRITEPRDQFGMFFELNPQPVWVYNSVSLAFLQVNEAAIRKYGYSRDEFLSMTIRNIYLEEDLRKLVSGRTGPRVKANSPVECRHRLKGGKIIDVEVSTLKVKAHRRNMVIAVVHDITEQKRAERALKEKEQLLSSMGRMAKVGGWEFDATTGKGSWTEEVARIHDLDPKAKTNVEIGLQFYEPKSRERIDNAIKKAIEEGQPYDLELELITAKGKHKLVRTIGVPIKEGGHVVKVRGSFQDITELRTAEKALSNYQLLAEHAQDIILFLNLDDGRILEANHAAEKAYGYSRSELLSLSIKNLRLPGEGAFVGNQMRSANRTPILFETVHVRKDGSTFPVEVNSQGIDHDGTRILISVIRDITKRLEVEREIQRQEQVLRLFVENSPAAIAMFDREMRYIVASRRYLSAYRLGDRDIIGRSHYDIFPEMPQRWKEIHERCLQGNIEKCDEDPFPRSDGTIDWVRWEIRPWYEDVGRIGGIILFSEVITEQKLKSEALELSSARMRGLIDSAMDGIISLNEKQEIILFNPAAERMFGIDAREMLGKSIDGLIPERFRKQHPGFIEAFGKSGETNASREMTGIQILSGLRANGEEFPIEASVSQIEVGGQKVYTVIHRDITERLKSRLQLEESEERFRKLYETAPVGISNISPEGKFIRCNPALERITGYTEQDLQSMTVYDITLPDDREATRQLGEALAEGMTTTGSLEKRYLRKDGEIVWIYLVSTGVYDSDGKLLYTVSITQDVTERKMADDRVKRLNRVYAVLSDINQALVRIRDTDELFKEACRVAVDVGGFRLAWIGVVDEKNGSVKPVAFSGDREGFSKLSEIAPPTDMPQRGPVGTAVLEKHHVVKNDVEHDGLSLPWSAEAIKRNLRSIAVFPLMSGDQVYGVICFYSSEVGFFDEQEVSLLKELSFDIMYSIENIKREEERKRLQIDRDRMFNYSVDMLAIIGFDSYLKQINPAWSRILGWTNEELMQRSFFDFVNPDDRESTRKFAAGLAEGKTAYAFENRCACKDGSDKWLSWNCVPLVEEKMIFAVIRDITDQKRDSEQLLIRNSAIESSISAIGLADMQGKIFYVNGAFLKLWGYDSSRDVLGKNISRFSISDERLLAAVRTMMTGKGFLGESKGNRRDGTSFDFEISASVVKSGLGEPICMMASFMDITERKRSEEKLNIAYEDLKRSEEKYRSLFEQSKDAIIMANNDGSLIDANPVAVELLGFDSKDEFIGTNMGDIYANPEDRRALLEVLDFDRYVKEREFVLKKKSGELITVSSSITAVHDVANHLVSILGIFHDVTKEKSLEAQLVQAQKLESLGTLAGGIAHDFNNILGIIMGYSGLMDKENPQPEKISKSVDAIQKAAERGTALVNQLLTFARKGESVYERVQVNDVVVEILKLLKEILPKTIEVVSVTDPALPLISADPAQLHQVLMNLCINSRDAMANGGTLKIRTEKLEGDSLVRTFPAALPGKYIVLAVSDTGTGMDEETKKRIFDPFFTTKEVGKGTGLGLALVHSIVANHEGFVDVATQLGMGTTFFIYLPVKEHKMDHVETADATLQDVPGGRETVLLIEDEEMLRDLVKTVIESKGYNVLTASDGEEGIDLFERRHDEIDVVISDLGLPKISGEEVLKRIRLIAPSARLVAASGFIEPEVKSSLLDIGVTRIVQKPYMISEILKTVREVIDKQE